MDQARTLQRAGPSRAEPPPPFGPACAVVDVYRLALDGATGASLARAACLSAGEMVRAARFRSPVDADRYMAARSGLRHVLGRALGRAPGALAFVEGPYGKPALAAPDDACGITFNVAHSGGMALIAVARGADVGVDVERIRPGVEAVRLAERLFTPAERARLAALPPEAGYTAFFALWAAKEAVVKGLGRGLFARLDGFKVRLDEAGNLVPQRLVSHDDRDPGPASGAPGAWWLAPLDVGEVYRAAVAIATPHDGRPPQIALRALRAPDRLTAADRS